MVLRRRQLNSDKSKVICVLFTAVVAQIHLKLNDYLEDKNLYDYVLQESL
jgi:hypothetical protein